MNIFMLHTAGWQKASAVFIAFAMLLTAFPAGFAQAVVDDFVEEDEVDFYFCKAAGNVNSTLNYHSQTITPAKAGAQGIWSDNGANEWNIIPAVGDNPAKNWGYLDWLDMTGEEFWEKGCIADEIVDPEPKEVTIVATKIVCEDASLLPQGGYSSITADTAANFLASTPERTAGCDYVADWQFQWALGGIQTSGAPDNQGVLDGPWNTSDMTDMSGQATIVIDEDTLGHYSTISMREVWSDEYIEFSGVNGSAPSAEFYCHTDAGNFDNLEWISGVATDNTYHCVAWNVPVEPELTECTFVMVSDDLDFVVEKNDYAKILSEPYNSRWITGIVGSLAKWIWGDDPVQEPTTVDETQVFMKSFEWTGTELDSATLTIASDNSHAITLGDFTGGNPGEVNYQGTEDYDVTDYIENGLNMLEVAVKNFALANSDASTNPAGLLYELKIEGRHTDEHCGEVVPVEPTPEEPVAEVNVFKIICEDESQMPKGNVAKPFTATTAQTWVDENESCNFAEGWEFQWAPQGTSNPDNDLPDNPLYGEAAGDWVTFGPTNTNGLTTLNLTAADIDGLDYIWVREVLQEGFVPFTYGPGNLSNDDDFTAEMYCHVDVRNFDNYDRVDGIAVDESYYCVAWNMPLDKEEPVIDDEEEEDNGDNGSGNDSEEIDEPTPTVSSTASRRSSGSARNVPVQTPVPQVLGEVAEAAQCGPLLTTFMRKGLDNDEMEVYKLQAFLIASGYSDASLFTGVFDEATDAAVKAFQLDHRSEVLTPWLTAGIVPHDKPTGWVYRTTKWKINNIYCPGSEDWPGLI